MICLWFVVDRFRSSLMCVELNELLYISMDLALNLNGFILCRFWSLILEEFSIDVTDIQYLLRWMTAQDMQADAISNTTRSFVLFGFEIDSAYSCWDWVCSWIRALFQFSELILIDFHVLFLGRCFDPVCCCKRFIRAGHERCSNPNLFLGMHTSGEGREMRERNRVAWWNKDWTPSHRENTDEYRATCSDNGWVPSHMEPTWHRPETTYNRHGAEMKPHCMTWICLKPIYNLHKP